MFTELTKESEFIIEKHKHSRRQQSEPRDFIDAFLDEMDNHKSNEKSPLGPIDGEKNLAGALSDFLAAGTDTTCNIKKQFRHCKCSILLIRSMDLKLFSIVKLIKTYSFQCTAVHFCFLLNQQI